MQTPRAGFTILVLVVATLAACKNGASRALQEHAERTAAPGSALNAINRENREPGLGTVQKAATTSAESLIRRVWTDGTYTLEQVQLPNEPALLVQLVYRKDAQKPMPVVIGFPPGTVHEIVKEGDKLPRQTPGPIATDKPIVTDLFKSVVDRGAMLATVTPRPIPWPEGRNRWIWPTPDAAGAQFFITWARVAPWDFGPLLDYTQTRPDVRPERVGYFGFSTTALIGYGLVAHEPRVNVAVLLGGAGDLAEFAAGWARNYDWESKRIELWPETLEALAAHNPLLKADRVAPKAILMMNGGDDTIIPIEAARSYFKALLPHYQNHRDRLQLIVFEGEGHNWHYPNHTQMLLEWFDRFLFDSPGKH